MMIGNKLLSGASGLAMALAASAGIGQELTNPDRLAELMTGRPYSPYADRAFPTEVFFGDVHVHTGLSGDAGGGGTRLMPRDAYRFASGEQVVSNTGQPVKLGRPFDFMAVADHSDGMGVILDILAGAPNIMKVPYGRELNAAFNAGGKTAADAMYGLIAKFSQGEVPAELNYQPGNPAYRATWETIIDAAEEYNRPGTFTTLIGYEWTSLVKGNNLHRVVLLRDGEDQAKMVEPYTTTPPQGSPNPRDLWRWMAEYEGKTGGQTLAIPHNGNLSNGWMFPLVDDFDGGKPLDKAYADLRARWEPLYEATQPKGDSETHPLLSPDDRFADFETWDSGNLDLSQAKTPEMLPGDYARSGLQRGLVLAAGIGTNPYKFGLIGSTDIHTGLPTTENENFFGKVTSDEPGPGRATHLAKQNEKLGLKRYGWEYAAAGLVAVWASENTRAGLFDAMLRKETYATTGTRIRVRFFGGRDFTDADVKRRDLAQVGYARGVPMGSDLPAGKGAPSFLVYALRDPMGANLDRIQIVKSWLGADGKPREKVFDVAWSGDRKPDEEGNIGPVGSTVDLTVPAWTNTIGAAELGAVWRDPGFDPALSAVYYARVLEIPTPRWTAYDAVKFGLDLPKDIPVTQQERAYTSPIWYTPPN